jgi:GWxTD domain-containing protein
MQHRSTWSRHKGHPTGGPCCFRASRLFRGAAFLALLAGGVAGCGTRGAERPAPARGEPFARPLDIYRDLGFLTGSGQFPVVASFSTLAGPGDSTLVMMGLSMPNSALRFQRDGGGFLAEYDVNVVLLDRDSVPIERFSTRESVRIPTFGETSRTDESVVFQRAFTVVPGRYVVQLQAGDAHSARGFRMTDTITAPAYGAAGARVGTPILAYQATGRAARDGMPLLILNPRHTVPYGGESPLLYVEAYGAAAELTVEVVNTEGQPVWSGPVPLEETGAALRSATVRIPSELFPLGRFWVQVTGSGVATERRPLLLTISDQWMVANFEEVLQFLRYIALQEEMDSLRSGTPAERRERWEQFWERRNDVPQAGINEFRDRFFQRVRFATEAFREAGRAGWQTDRGEVYIVLGAPDQVVERYLGRTDLTGRPNAVEWVYTNSAAGRINLLFHDRTGFGRMELVPSSASAFRSAADRMKPRRQRN